MYGHAEYEEIFVLWVIVAITGIIAILMVWKAYRDCAEMKRKINRQRERRNGNSTGGLSSTDNRRYEEYNWGDSRNSGIPGWGAIPEIEEHGFTPTRSPSRRPRKDSEQFHRHRKAQKGHRVDKGMGSGPGTGC